MNKSVLATLALVLTSSCLAEEVNKKPFVADTAEKFAATAVEVRQQMETGGRYEFIKPVDKGRAEADMQTMQALLQKSGSVAAMNDQEKVKLFNAQENLNGILTHSDSNRLVCEVSSPIGSNIKQTRCNTYGDLERTRRSAGKYMDDSLGVAAKCMPANHGVAGANYCRGH